MVRPIIAIKIRCLKDELISSDANYLVHSNFKIIQIVGQIEGIFTKIKNVAHI